MKTENIDVLRATFNYRADTGVLTRAIDICHFLAGSVVGGVCPASGYHRLRFKGQSFKAHRVIWAIAYGYFPDVEIDHINGVKTDNRLSNLRLATHTQNMQNASLRKDNKLGLKGVMKRGGKYLATIAVGGKTKYLGSFGSEAEAHNAYCVAAKKNFGEFANFGCGSPATTSSISSRN